MLEPLITIHGEEPSPDDCECAGEPEPCADCHRYSRHDPFDDGHLGAESVWAVWPGMHPGWGM